MPITVKLQSRPQAVVEVRASFSFRPAGGWVGPTEVLTHPSDQEAVAHLQNGGEQILPRGYKDCQVYVRLYFSGRQRCRLAIIPARAPLIVRREDMNIIFPTLLPIK